MSITLFQAPAACSLYRTSKIILQTKDGKICAYCYEVCKKNEQPQVTATFQDSADKCSCTHEETPKFFEDKVVEFFTTAKDKAFSIRTLSAYNHFLAHKKNNKSIFEIGFPKITGFLSKDYQACINGTFNWNDIDVPAIKERADFVVKFNTIFDEPKSKLLLLNTVPMEELFPLKFIDLITDFPNYTFGQPIYNESLNFYTYLLDFFCKFYLEKDFLCLDRIDGADIETYSPIARFKIREKNRKNQFIIDKYFNNDFNLLKFGVKLVEKFVCGASWRWIGGQHKAHIYCAKVCKILMEYGLPSEDDCELIKNVLYLKIQVYRTLEGIIQNEVGKISDYWIGFWYDGLTKVREYYCEILIHYLYLKQDNEVVTTLKKIYQQLGESNRLTKEKVDEIIASNLSHSVLFEQEFARKMMDFLLGYILSQNKINSKVLSNQKIERIADNFLHIFSNLDDPFLHSIRLMTEQEYLNFVKESLNVIRVPLEISKELEIEGGNLKKLTTSFSKGKFFNIEKTAFLELSGIMDKLDEKLGFMAAVANKSEQDIVKQKAIFETNLPMTILHLTCNLVIYHNDQLKETNKKEKDNIFGKISAFMQFFLNNNVNHHSCFFLDENMKVFEQIFEFIPMETLELLHDVFAKNTLSLLVKDGVFEVFSKLNLDYFAKMIENPTIENYRIFSKIIDILALCISHKKKISEWLSEDDIRLTMDLVSDSFKEIFELEQYKTLLKEFKGDTKSLNDEKLLCYMNFLNLVALASSFRYDDVVYIYMNEKFPMNELASLIEISGSNLAFRLIFMELYSNFHVDFKNNLLDNRANYYFTKPDDMQYEEDPFFDKEYEKTMDMLIRELKFMAELFEMKNQNKFDEQIFIDYINSALFGTLIKLMNYFLVIKEADLSKLSKYIPKLEEIKNYIFGNTAGILVMYGIDVGEMSSPERKKYEVELAKIDPDLKIKLDKKKIIGSCKIILEACSHIVKHKPLVANKSKLILDKTSVQRTAQTRTAIQNFSNKLAFRKENINLPFIKAEKRREKQGKKGVEVVGSLQAHYERNKMVKTSVDLEKNIYIFLLKDEKNVEMMEFGKNLCAFIHNQLIKDWKLDERNSKFAMIACLINTLFISTKAMQTNFFNIIQESGNNDFLDKIWTEMKLVLTYVKFKTNIDKYWKEAFKRCMLLIKFHQYLCEDNCEQFKELMRTKILPNDTIDRVQRWTTIFQRLSDNCQWHCNYIKGEINDYERFHRPYLFPLATLAFDNLAELCTGPYLPNQLKVYTYIYDRYNGILARYWRDPDSDFYKAKLSLIEFIVCMVEGNDPKVINYQTTNLELTNMFTIIVNSLRQLFYCIARKDPFEKDKMSDYPLYMKDYDEIQNAFLMNSTFYKHTLLEICIKLFAYIKTMAEVKSKYEIFCNEREEQLRQFERTGKTTNATIKEEELVTFKFLSNILIKIEICRDESKLIPFYFPISSKCYYLSEASKEKFLTTVDRSSCEAKLSGLYSEKSYFKKEMYFNQERYNNRLNLYRLFGSGNYIYFEILTLLLAYVNNFILALSSDVTMIPIIAGLELFGSVVGLLLYTYFSYPLVRQLNRQRYVETNVTTSQFTAFWNQAMLDIFDSFLFQKYVWVFLYHIFCLTMGLSYNSVFIAFDLLSTINLFDTMQFILRSVTEHIGQLMSTLALSALLIYVFSMIVNFFFMNNMPSYECSNFVSCYFYIMEQAFTNGQGLAGITSDSSESTEDMTEFYELFLLNITFFILINTVLLNIILAILVDTFSNLRAKDEFFEKDSKTICFICGIQKYMFEKSGIDFETHVSKEHDVWNYANFLVFMMEKTEKDCNGVEAEIFTKIKTGNLDWFPMQRSIVLEKIQEYSNQFSAEKAIMRLEKKIDKLAEDRKSIVA